MKNDKEQTSKSLLPTLILVGSVFGTLLIVGAIGYLLIMPTFTNLNKVEQEIKLQTAKLDKIDQAVNTLKAQDKDLLDGLARFYNTLVPENIDMLHFATLNEIVARESGAQITAISLSKGLTTTAQPQAGSTTGAAASSTAPQSAPTSVKVTYRSNFTSLLNMLKYWFLADQIVGVQGLTISGEADGIITYTVSYDLPKGAIVANSSIENPTVLTKKEIEEFQNLKKKIIYTATPSANPLGKDNPFLE